ncbi:MAG: hypothetical protein WAV13_01445 [Thermodesulfovibrionales bacterium]
MKRKIMVVTCSVALLLSAGACKKKQEQPVPQANIPGQQMPAGQPGMPPGQPGMQQQQPIVMPQGETKVVMLDAVKGQWKAVVLQVESKATKKTAEYTVNINSDFKVPNSNLKITVGEFLPDFRMNGLEITSTTNEPNNPAVGVRIYDGSKQVFPASGKKWGWLYAKFPTMHPFEHPEFSILLKGGVKKG